MSGNIPNKLVKGIKNPRDIPPYLVCKTLQLQSIYINDIESWASQNGKIYYFGSDGNFTINPPLTNEIPNEFKNRNVNGRQRYNKELLVEVPHGKVIGQRGLCTSKHGQFITEPYRLESYIQNYLQSEINESGLEIIKSICSSYRRGPKFETVVHLVNRHQPPKAPPNYGHWIVEYLPQLRIIERYEKTTKEDVKLLIDGDPPPWMTESLNLMGWPQEKLIKWNSKFARTKKLVIPERKYLHSSKAWFNPEGRKWVRDRVSNNISQKYKNKNWPSRIFLPRKNANYREIINRKEVGEMLASYGFTEVYPEELSMQEEVALFSQVDMLVSPYGSNLAGLMYSQDCIVIDIQPDGFFGMFYYVLANEVDLKYDYISGNEIDNKDPGLPDRHQDILVDIDELEQVISNAIGVLGE